MESQLPQINVTACISSLRYLVVKKSLPNAGEFGYKDGKAEDNREDQQKEEEVNLQRRFIRRVRK